MQQINGPLMVGSSGADVKILQSVLNQVLPSKQLVTDGNFGVRTEAAVRSFQRSRQLRCDGIVGPKTAEALGLSYVARAPVQSISEVRRRNLRAASAPGDLQNGDSDVAASGVNEEGGAGAALAAAVISSYTVIYRRLKRMLKNAVAVSGENQKQMGAFLMQAYASAVATVGAIGRSSNVNALASTVISSTGLWCAALAACAALLSASPAPEDRQLSIRFRSISRALNRDGQAAAIKVNALLRGSGERLDVAVPSIMNKLISTVR